MLILSPTILPSTFSCPLAGFLEASHTVYLIKNTLQAAQDVWKPSVLLLIAPVLLLLSKMTFAVYLFVPLVALTALYLRTPILIIFSWPPFFLLLLGGHPYNIERILTLLF